MNAHMCHSEKYFPDAGSFKPERWLKTNTERADIHPYTFLPFGHGARMCIGRRFAEQEMWLLATKVTQ